MSPLEIVVPTHVTLRVRSTCVPTSPLGGCAVVALLISTGVVVGGEGDRAELVASERVVAARADLPSLDDSRLRLAPTTIRVRQPGSA